MRILELLKHGASFAAGVAVGRITVNNESDYTEDVWTGKTHTLSLTYTEAQKRLEEVTGWLNIDEDELREDDAENADSTKSSLFHPFWKDDLKDVETQLRHKISDAEHGEDVSIKITDRQRLLLLDLVLKSPSLERVRQVGLIKKERSFTPLEDDE